MGIRWHLRLRMAEKSLFQTSDLVPVLAERGIHLSREQVYRLVTQVPQRLSTDTLPHRRGHAIGPPGRGSACLALRDASQQDHPAD